jgi:hypothetical protein
MNDDYPRTDSEEDIENYLDNETGEDEEMDDGEEEEKEPDW